MSSKTAVATQTGGAPAGPDLFAGTPNIKKEPPKGDAHQGHVTGVSVRTFDSGATALELGVHSDDENFDTTYMLFLPEGFVENVKVDPGTLSNVRPEKVKDDGSSYEGQSEQQKYAARIRNEAGTGELEQLFSVAASQGRTEGVDLTFDDLDSLVEVLNKCLAGAEFVFTRAADKNGDPAFADQLRVKKLINPIETVGKLAGTLTIENPKRFQKLRKAWES